MRISPLIAVAAIVALPACATAQATPSAPAPLTVELKGPTGAAVGTATLTEAPKGVLMRLQVNGLTPGWHGLHFHEKADCSAADFTSAGGHVHAGGERVHGLLNPNANESGDLPNLFADAHGAANGEFFSQFVSLSGAGGRTALTGGDGSAIVIHANPDDQVAQPIGRAGARVACGMIR